MYEISHILVAAFAFNVAEKSGIPPNKAMFIICSKMPNKTSPTRIISFLEYESDNDNFSGFRIFLGELPTSILNFLLKMQLDEKTPKIKNKSPNPI